MPKYFSGRSKRTPQSGLTSDRYQYLSIEQAEPNLGDPPEVDNIPEGQQYQIVSVETHPGKRFWKPIGGGVIPGALTVRDEGIILPTGANAGPNAGVNSITELNIKGNILTAVGTTDSNNNPGAAITITAAPVGNDHEVLFNNNGEFGAASGLSYDNTNHRVGIGSTQPQETLDIDGTLFITGNVFDKTHSSGSENEVLVRHPDGGLVWAEQSTTGVSDAAGDPTQVQYHGSDGKLAGGTLLVYDYTNGTTDERVGIGSTQPTRLLDVLGDSRFVGVTTFEGNVFVEGVVTSEDVTNIDSLGIVTAQQGFRATNGGLEVVGVTTLANTRILHNDDNGNALFFGKDTVNNLEIKFDGTDSVINDVSTANLGFKLQQGGNTKLEVTGAGVTVTGVTTTNILSVTGFVTSHLIPSPPSVGLFDLGSEDNKWDNIWANTINVGSYNPTVLTVEQLKVTGFSTFVGLATFNGGLEVVQGITTFNGTLDVNSTSDFAGNINVSSGNISIPAGGLTVGAVGSGVTFTQDGDGYFHRNLYVSGLSTFAGITTVTGDTLFTKQFSSGISSIGIGSANSLYVSGLSTFVGFSTFKDVIVGGMSTFVGISSFEGNVSFNAGIKDKDGELGNQGWLLESRDNKVNWVNPQGLSVENAERVGVGTTGAVSVGATSIYYPTFVDSNNTEARDLEYLYSGDALTYNVYYDNGVGIGSIGIGTTTPNTTLDVLGITSFRGNVYFNGIQNNVGNVGFTSLTWQSGTGRLKFQDEVWASFGDENDLRIYHTGELKGQTDKNGDPVTKNNNTNCSYIHEKGSSGLVFKSDGGGGPGAFQFFDEEWRPLLRLHSGNNARALLYHKGKERLETIGTGVTVTGITTTNSLSVSGISSFWGPVWDEDGSPGASTYLLESTVTGVNWKAPDDITVQNALKVGVGTTGAVSTGGTSIYYPTFVDSNNTEGRELEYLYSGNALTYNVHYVDGVGIGSIGIGTTTPRATLDVLGISSFRGDVYFNGTDGDVTGITSLTWKQSTGTLEFKDDVKAVFGTDSDLEIYHEASSDQSTIYAPNKAISINSGVRVEIEEAGGENMAVFNVGAGVSLYYNREKKFETTGTGVTVTGLTSTTTFMVKEEFYDSTGSAGSGTEILTSTGSAVKWENPQGLSVENAKYVGVGTTAAASDGISTSIYYPVFVDSNNNESREYEALYSNRGLSYNVHYVNGVGVGSLGIGTTTPNTTLDVLGITSFRGDVYFNNDVTGITSIGWRPSDGSLRFEDDISASFGTGGDLKIIHQTTGTEDEQGTYIAAGTGHLFIQSADDQKNIYIRAQSNHESIICYDDGQVELYYDALQKLSTLNTGVEVTGVTTTNSLSVSGISSFWGPIWDRTGSAGDSSMVLQPDGDGVKWKKIDNLTADSAIKINTVGITTDNTYYPTFVERNNSDPGQQESIYTGVGITFNPGTGYLYLEGSLHLDGTDADTDGDIHSWGGSDGEFAISNEGSGPIHLLVQDSDGGDAIGIVSFSSESGNNAAARQSIFASNIYPKDTDTYDIGEYVIAKSEGDPESKRRWNNVYAKDYHGETLNIYDSDNTNKITLQPPATENLTSDYTLTLPVNAGSADGDVLQTDGNGVLSWTSTIEAQAEKAITVGIGTTTNRVDAETVDDVQEYYVPFVRDNNPHSNRQYEKLYSDSKLVYRYTASSDTGGVGINTDVVGQELNVFSRGFAGVRVKSSRTTDETMGTMTQIGGLQFADSDSDVSTYPNGKTMSAIVGTLRGDLILKTGHDEIDNGSLDRVTITPVGHVGIGTTNPITYDTTTGKTITDYLRLNTKVLAVGVVTCHKLYVDGNEITDGGGGGGGLSAVEVKQYKTDLGPNGNPARTVRTCDALDAPITVATSGNTAIIGIGSTSNAYGNRYVSEDEPVGNLCEGDIWYDTSGGESSEVTTGVLATVLMYEKKNSGEEAGVFTSGVWETRKLNTTEDPQNVVTSIPDGGDGQTSSYFKLKKGTYKIEWEAPAYQSAKHKSRLTISNNADFANENIVEYVDGTSEWAAASAAGPGSTKSYGTKTITLTSTTAGDRYFKIEHYKQDPYSADNGLGLATGAAGAFEIYTRVRVLKLDVDGIGSGGGGADKFIDLTDTPNNYANAGNQVVSVKSDLSGLEFTNRGATVTTSDTAPDNPSAGDLWWNSTTGILNVYYDDGQGNPSTQWVNATGRSPSGSADVPIGGIIMWSGSQNNLNIYFNWKICDGNNGTPDLRDRFIIGASSYNAFEEKWKTGIEGTAKQSGGSKNAILPAHSHGDPTWDGQSGQYEAAWRNPKGGYDYGNESAPTEKTAIDADGTTTTGASATLTGTNANLPPYYALAYIMRVS